MAALQRGWRIAVMQGYLVAVDRRSLTGKASSIFALAQTIFSRPLLRSRV